MKAICHHFTVPQRDVHFRQIQRKMEPNDAPVEIPEYIEIRFLSLYESTTRILGLWKCLEEYKKAESKFPVEINEHNQVLITILDNLLEKLSGANKFFQNDHLLFPEIYDKLMTTFTNFAKIIARPPPMNNLPLNEEFRYYYELPWDKEETLKKDHLKDIERIKSDHLNWLFIDNSKYFESFNKESQEKLLKGIQSFILTSLFELKKTVNFQNC